MRSLDNRVHLKGKHIKHRRKSENVKDVNEWSEKQTVRPQCEKSVSKLAFSGALFALYFSNLTSHVISLFCSTPNLKFFRYWTTKWFTSPFISSFLGLQDNLALYQQSLAKSISFSCSIQSEFSGVPHLLRRWHRNDTNRENKVKWDAFIWSKTFWIHWFPCAVRYASYKCAFLCSHL